MNKTVNINLAGIFFHIDEDAYLKLQRYLDAIKRSFTDSQGRSEIIADIESRIAELFMELVKHDKQVIGTKEVDDVIAIMGQPEDYLVDDEIFEDEPKTFQKTKSAASKKLFRDTDNSYIGGVSSGLGHYLGIDAVWVRLIWLLLVIGSGGTFILIYILFWVLVPEAKTTAEKIMMTGEPVNISNIEKKIKDGFDSVSETMTDVAKNVSDSVSNAARKVDVKKQANSIKSSSKSFFETLGEIIMFFLKMFAKFVGVIMILIGSVSLLVLVVSLLSFGTTKFFHPWWLDYPDALNTTGLPLWLGSVLLFFLFGIPLFFILYLGLKILINNLKSIGKIAKFTLLGLWLLSIVSLIIISIKEASYFSLENSVTQTEVLPISITDTLSIKMVANDFDKYKYNMYRSNGFDVKYNNEDEKVIFSRNINLKIRSTTDSVVSLQIVKEASGRDFIEARETAEKINYNFSLKNNQLLLNNALQTAYENKFLKQNVTLILHLPEGTIFKLTNNTRSFLNNKWSSENIVDYNDASHVLKVLEDAVVCLDCPIKKEFEVDVDVQNESDGIKINTEGIEIKADGAKIEINSKGIKAKTKEVNINVNSDSLNIKSKNNPL
jgi:phage shock protein PspC (stress-responsive transcriptional regulator)